MIEASESSSADCLALPDKESAITGTWNGRLLTNVGSEQAQLGNALEEIRRRMAIQGPEQLERFDNCLITFIAFNPDPNAPFAKRVADLKNIMLASQIDPRIVDILKA